MELGRFFLVLSKLLRARRQPKSFEMGRFFFF